MEDIGGLQKYLDGLPELEQAVRHKGFVSLVHDQPCTVSTLAHQLGQTETAIEKTIAAMEKRGTLIWDHVRQELNATGGLSRTPTAHSLKFDQREMFAWCAADAVGIPAALSLDAEIDSACHFCGTPIRIVLKKGRIQEASPHNPQVFVAHADPAQSVSGHTWSQINFFCSVEHAHSWMNAYPDTPGTLLDLPGAVELGLLWWNEFRYLANQD